MLRIQKPGLTEITFLLQKLSSFLLCVCLPKQLVCASSRIYTVIGLLFNFVLFFSSLLQIASLKRHANLLRLATGLFKYALRLGLFFLLQGKVNRNLIIPEFNKNEVKNFNSSNLYRVRQTH